MYTAPTQEQGFWVFEKLCFGGKFIKFVIFSMPILYLILFEFCETFSCVLDTFSSLLEPMGCRNVIKMDVGNEIEKYRPRGSPRWIRTLRARSQEGDKGEVNLPPGGRRFGKSLEEGQDEGKPEWRKEGRRIYTLDRRVGGFSICNFADYRNHG